MLSERADWRSVPCDEFRGGKDKYGYGRQEFQGRKDGAHRVAWIKAYGPIPSGEHVLHYCDNPPCREPLHLFLGTPKMNAQDRTNKDRNGKKLTNAQVAEIRRRVAAGERQVDLSREFGVSKALISMTVNMKLHLNSGSTINSQKISGGKRKKRAKTNG